MLNTVWLVCLSVASTIFGTAVPQVASEVAQESNPIKEDAVIETTVSQEAPVIATAPTSYPSAVPGRPIIKDPLATYAAGDAAYILNWYEYVLTYEGLCPHEQPEHPFKANWQWLTAIGFHYERFGVEDYLAQIWADWRLGLLTGVTPHYPGHIDRNLKFEVDWSTLAVIDQPYFTSVLRGFETAYQAHCPND